MTNFSDLGLAEPILRAVTDEGYTTPTPIQTKAIPVSLTGKDILGIAQTGTGKTAAFVLPMLDRIARQGGKAAPKTCGALIMAPTRELVSQIADNIRNYSKFMRVSVTVIVGGVKPRPQINRLMAGTDIIVATPGRLLDHMNNGILRLDQTHTVVLDEADHMLDLGFIPDIRRIMKKLPKKRQTSLFSATMPTAIRSLANDFQTNPVEVSVAAASRPIERINQSVQHTPHAAKRDVLTQILSKEGVERAIVFTRTKRGADRVSMHLQKAGLSAAAIHGNKSQSQRVRALADFKAGQTNIMVATDIAARGIDIDDVSHVVNFELPEVAEAYVHRIGRTARAGREGIAISLCDPSEAKLLREIEKLIGSKLARDGVEAYSPGDAPVPDTAIKADPGVRGPKRKPRAYRGKGGGAGPNSGNGNTGKPANAKNRRRPSGKPNTGFGRPAGQAAGHRKGNRGGGAAAHA
ncbi:DEAD/DEAH box helicase [Cohaesibacter celericrescens]|uniref:DEAD-box ATP-dependent RNA helicase RhpA n=1 Tax=Cohaesibacter celericrescens TaxID=2067669 RepID=A0A2N5XVA4_9HYPH|nr:DEAD/DEAH box helicase [Cohaesibacter celericrescens]PLW78456.1 DEAD/DEAH box helicase [Cohaesibacter celericrescens]